MNAPKLSPLEREWSVNNRIYTTSACLIVCRKKKLTFTISSTRFSGVFGG